MSIFTSAVLQGLNAVDHISAGVRECFPGWHLSNATLARTTGSTRAVMSRTLYKLTKSGIISVKRGPRGGFFITEEQLRTKRVKDVLEALGQPVFAPEGSRASDRLQQVFHDACDVTLEEFFA